MKFKILGGIIFLALTLAAMGGAWQAPDQEAARIRAMEKVDFVPEYRKEDPVVRRLRLVKKGVSMDHVTDVYFLLDSPIIKAREDQFQPVRFAHKRHAGRVKDCSKCHHYRPDHENALETTRCSACHQDSFNPERPQRMGLKGVYHQQCISCHREEAQGPVGCKECHLKQVPDHKELVSLPADPSPFQVTAECLRCHDTQGEEMLTSAHWLWKGPSPYTTGHRREVLHGKGTTALNNY